MPSAPQSAAEIRSILGRLHGQEVASLQVLGINSLKSITPLPDVLVGEVVTGSEVNDRTFRIETAAYSVVFDLQRSGKILWITNAMPYTLVAGGARPTVRLLLADGTGFDLTEPAKTKRITVALTNRNE